MEDNVGFIVEDDVTVGQGSSYVDLVGAVLGIGWHLQADWRRYGREQLLFARCYFVVLIEQRDGHVRQCPLIVQNGHPDVDDVGRTHDFRSDNQVVSRTSDTDGIRREIEREIRAVQLFDVHSSEGRAVLRTDPTKAENHRRSRIDEIAGRSRASWRWLYKAGRRPQGI